MCLVFGCLVIAAAHSKTVKRRPALLKVLIPVGICLYLVLAFGFGIDISARLAEAVGRDPTLTGRTVIWNAVLSTHTNPLIGSGYESFWLGPRLQEVWAQTGGGITEAHNGYLEIYLNLGIVGLSPACSILDLELPLNLQQVRDVLQSRFAQFGTVGGSPVLQRHRGSFQRSFYFHYFPARSHCRPAGTECARHLLR